MSMPTYTVFMLENNQRIGEVEYTRLECANRYMKKGRWELAVEYLPATPTWKSRIEVVRKGETILTGPFTRLERNWTYAEVDDRKFSGTCDLIYMEHRYASPDPSLSTGPYNTQVADIRTGDAESVIRGYVNYNIGPSAVATRQLSGFTIETNQNRGSSIKGRARFDDLMEMCRTLALAGHIAFKIEGLQLKFYVPQDKTGSVIFSSELDNMVSFEYHGAPSSANYVLVAGGGEGTSRTTYELGDSESITANGRKEVFVDARQTTDTAELAQKAIATLEEESEEDLNVHVVPGPAAAESMAPYDNFYLGDRITLKVDDLAVDAEVQEIGVVDSKDNVEEHITLGAFGKGQRLITSMDLIAALSTRIRRLEVR